MILYWDSIGTIIPSGLEGSVDKSEDIKQLIDAGIFEWYSPDSFVHLSDELSNEFIELTRSSKHQLLLSRPDKQSIARYQVYSRKMSERLVSYLVEHQFATLSDDHWLEMDRKAGLLYMCLLAKYMADTLSRNNQIITPGTDYGAYRDLILQNLDYSKALPGLSLTLNNLLPVPRSDLPLKDILIFKKKRENELLAFRQIIYEFQDSITLVRDPRDLQEQIARFSEKLKLEIYNLDRILTSDKIPYLMGALESVLKIDSPSILSEPTTLGTIPIWVSVSDVTIRGILSLVAYNLNERNRRRQELSRHSYSYLYHAQHEGIINSV